MGFPWPLPTRTHICILGPIQLEIQIDIKYLFMNGFR